jgi:hypothetical protein
MSASNGSLFEASKSITNGRLSEALLDMPQMLST